MKAFDPYLNTDEFFYTCVAGETIEDIAGRFRVPAEMLREANNLTDNIAAGDEIYIRRIDCDVYRVKAGDTAASVAEKFGTDEAELLSFNRCAGIYPGQILYFDKKK